MTSTNMLPHPELSRSAWFKSSYSDGGENCIEVADLRQTDIGRIAVRDSKNPNGPALLLEPASFSTFAQIAATGGFDA
ncbi:MULTISPECIES: DUF397 domain-containing protein [unclassified Streptomyces]|uniref:DUF397 domain-containing protein n=1 Tax=unclassified Streptomyces TaxID=2593676 RepID=UPI00225513C0|nr:MULTISPECIES: DUF397 domain-containing protein [unclassified Streptomyces]MCX4633129.1 DUF397 domain-containing protein [Streptomyces sp. NBC_01443]WSN46286.1 DUF397 domain-containing protein [Streptomyces sp. NBC_01296]WSW48655.1 DUF397 domain-containing protein [Streptomyces sp. NBC_01001]